MSHSMNGKPMHCVPARTRCWEDRLVTGLDPETPLAEMPMLVAKAVRAGLIQRPDPSVPEPVRKHKNPRKKAPLVPTPCLSCGAIFMFNKQDRRKTCSKECGIVMMAAGLRKHRQQQKQPNENQTQ